MPLCWSFWVLPGGKCQQSWRGASCGAAGLCAQATARRSAKPWRNGKQRGPAGRFEARAADACGPGLDMSCMNHAKPVHSQTWGSESDRKADGRQQAKEPASDCTRRDTSGGESLEQGLRRALVLARVCERQRRRWQGDTWVRNQAAALVQRAWRTQVSFTATERRPSTLSTGELPQNETGGVSPQCKNSVRSVGPTSPRSRAASSPGSGRACLRLMRALGTVQDGSAAAVRSGASPVKPGRPGHVAGLLQRFRSARRGLRGWKVQERLSAPQGRSCRAPMRVGSGKDHLPGRRQAARASSTA